jgi:hypothetical protein
MWPKGEHVRTIWEEKGLWQKTHCLRVRLSSRSSSFLLGGVFFFVATGVREKGIHHTGLKANYETRIFTVLYSTAYYRAPYFGPQAACSFHVPGKNAQRLSTRVYLAGE